MFLSHKSVVPLALGKTKKDFPFQHEQMIIGPFCGANVDMLAYFPIFLKPERKPGWDAHFLVLSGIVFSLWLHAAEMASIGRISSIPPFSLDAILQTDQGWHETGQYLVSREIQHISKDCLRSPLPRLRQAIEIYISKTYENACPLKVLEA